MSTVQDDSWVLGETWSEIISCRDADGQPFTPLSADYKLVDLSGNDVWAYTSLDTDRVIIDADEVTVIISTFDQSSISSRTYRRRLKVTDSNGAISRQVSGIISVLPADDD